jgi:hypothetical protein
MRRHFPTDFDAIVVGSFSQLHGGPNTSDYSIAVIKGKRVVNQIAWYHEKELTLLPEQDRDRAELMLEKYNTRSRFG